jgi:hypothetical protein
MEYAALNRLFAARILCARHNDNLSEIDSEALRLFRCLETIAKGFIPTGRCQRDRFHLFSGHDIEAWLLKMLCGYVAAGERTVRGFQKGVVPPEWVDILFGRSELENGQGLYVPEYSPPGADALGFGIVIETVGPLNEPDIVLALHVAINAQHLLLLLDPDRFDPRMIDAYDWGFKRRPTELYFTDGAADASIILSWDRPTSGSTVATRAEYTGNVWYSPGHWRD